MSVPRVVGIDPSLTATACAWPDGRVSVDGRKGVTTMPVIERSGVLLQLVDQLRERVGIVPHLRQPSTWPQLLLIEGLPAGMKFSAGTAERAYMWWEFVRQCSVLKVPVLSVEPSTLKTYATGKGSASKQLVIDALARRMPQFETGGDENMCDAAWLCAIGCDLLGAPIVVVPAGHRRALDKLRPLMPAHV